MRTGARVSKTVLIGTLGVLCMTSAALADAATTLQSETARMDSLASSQGSAKVQQSLVTDFSGFAGSDANAQSLVTGLRSGTSITLSSTSTTSTGTTTVTASTFDPPTRPMGYGNVFISLALAKQQLASYGVTDPTPQEIQAALNGGTITTSTGTVTLKGVLTQRASGMGWGNIARSLGMNLGQVVSGMRSANRQLATTSTVSTTGSTSSASRTQTRVEVTTAGGGSSNARGHSEFSSGASGIVTAGGAGVAARGSGAGIVTGAGAPVTTGAGASAGAHGQAGNQGQAKGLFKQ